MNIFTEIEGLSGEELSSALLRYLLLNSSEARENIISFFSKHSPIGPLISYSHFSCNREYPTQYEDRKSEQEKVRGRIDLLIELDGAIIGIENKLFANFGDDQPKKYLQTLEDIRSTLSKIRLPKMKSAFFVLCPEFKENDAREKISDLKTPSKVVLWEKLISNLKQIEKITDPVSRVVLDELIIYIERKIDFLHDFSDWVPHLRNHFESKGSELQREVLRNIWKVFPAPGPKLGFGDHWVGYYFFSDKQQNDHKAWFGFVPGSVIDNKDARSSEFIIASTFYPESLSQSFEKIKLTNDNFVGRPKETHYWIVNFDGTWNTSQKWDKEIKPFWKGIE